MTYNYHFINIRTGKLVQVRSKPEADKLWVDLAQKGFQFTGTRIAVANPLVAAC